MPSTTVALIATAVVVLIVLIVLSARHTQRKAAERVAALTEWVRRHDGKLLAEDPSLVTRFAKPPFGRGSRRRPTNVLMGDHRGRSFTAFDYSYDTSSTGTDGHSSSDTHRYSIVTVPLGVLAPSLEVGPSSALRRLWGKLVGPAVTTGDTEFDREYAVRSDSPDFARDVLVPLVLDAQRRNPELSWRFEGDTMVVVRSGLHTAEDVEARLDFISSVLAGVPRHVWDRLRGELPR